MTLIKGYYTRLICLMYIERYVYIIGFGFMPVPIEINTYRILQLHNTEPQNTMAKNILIPFADILLC